MSQGTDGEGYDGGQDSNSLDDTWDVMKDLQFLIATDDQLQDELAQVWEILDSDLGAQALLPSQPFVGETDSDTVATSPASSPLRTSAPVECVDPDETTIPPPALSKRDVEHPKPKAQRSSVRQREEILLLRQQIEDLTAKLRAKETSAVSTTFDMTLWERTAKLECIEMKKALQENEQLKDAVYQQATFIDQMQRVFRKKPRIGTNIDIHSEEWQTYKLAAQASLREAAIHAIADRQYRRMQSAFVKAGVFHRESYLFHIKANPLPDNSYSLDMITHLTLDAPFRLVAAQAWQVCNGELAIDLPDGATELIARPSGGIPCHSNTIRKYYVEGDREVIVSRTVLEDAAMPHMSKGAVENRTMLQVMPLPDDPNRCRFTMLQVLIWPVEDPIRDDDGLDDVVEAMKYVCFGHELARAGTIPMAAQMDLTQLPYPSMGVFAERGRRFVRLIKAKVNEAIVNFNAPPPVAPHAAPSTQ
ncbi:hypothetical protein DYB32_006951 [Aphanomyces invadans]|uniref:START domain-containing protein n=1 Tax=Aphanomyces invadans TaxID=157072 RepID=A0A418APW4_9STRA|nr:hypothetical protein DYB32_006951 [Aphanomyces invadans]